MLTHTKKRRYKRKGNSMATFFVLLIILNLSFYQLYPLSLARADDTTPSEGETVSTEIEGSESEDLKEETETEETKEEPEEDSSDPEPTSDSEEPKSDLAEDEDPIKQAANEEISGDNQEQATKTSENESPDDDIQLLDATSDELQQVEQPLWKTCDLDEEENLFLENNQCPECTEKPTCNEISTCIKATLININKAEIANEVTSESITGSNEVTVPPTEEALAEETLQNDEANSPDSSSDASEKEEAAEPEQKEQTQATDGLSQNAEEPLLETTEIEEPTIETGDAISEVIIITETNVNAVAENAVRSVENVATYVGEINLLEQFLDIIANMTGQEENVSLEINNDNDAVIENDATTKSDSGDNTVNGDGDISTGNAYAAIKIVNIANQNIVGNNWLFSTINILGSWVGDLIVPGKGLLRLTPSGEYALVSVENENEAYIANNAEANASSGTNETSEGNVETGNAVAINSITTIANTNITKNNWFLLVINNMGNWIGKAFNYDEDDGSMAYAYDFELEGDSPDPTGTLSVKNENDATVTNDASAQAITGGNTISGSGNIETGDATAMNKIFNLINTNIVGSNWFFGIVNIMGQWDGNVIFAYPDLTISIDDGLSETYPDQNINYNVTVTNIGYASSEDTTVNIDLPENLTSSSGRTSWNMGALARGETKTFSFQTKTQSLSPEKPTTMKVTAMASTNTTEKQTENNISKDETTLMPLIQPSIVQLPQDYDYDFDTGLSVKRSSSSSGAVHSGEIVHQEIIVHNKSEVPLYNVIAKDKVNDSQGNNLGSYEWALGNMNKGDKLLISYNILISTTSQSVVYSYEAAAKGDDPFEHQVESNKARSILAILATPAYAYGDETVQSNEILSSLPENYVLGETMGDESKTLSPPSWIWILAAIAYFLAINWSFFPKKKRAGYG